MEGVANDLSTAFKDEIVKKGASKEGSKGLNWRLSSNIVSESGIIMGIVEAMQSQSGN